MLALLSKRSPAKTPQWPWSVYGHKQTSQAITKSGNHFRSDGMARITGFSFESADVPLLFWSWKNKRKREWVRDFGCHIWAVVTFGKFSVIPNSKIDVSPLATSGSKCFRAAFTPYRETPGILAISSTAPSSSLEKFNDEINRWDYLCDELKWRQDAIGLKESRAGQIHVFITREQFPPALRYVISTLRSRSFCRGHSAAIIQQSHCQFAYTILRHPATAWISLTSGKSDTLNCAAKCPHHVPAIFATSDEKWNCVNVLKRSSSN